MASPIQRRTALALITLSLAQLASTTDALMLSVVGGWTSILGFRRPLMSIMSRCFKLVPAWLKVGSAPKIIGLPRLVASELALMSVLGILAVTDLGAQYCERIFATDASIAKGGIVSSFCSPELQTILSRSCKTKGAFSRLLIPHECMLQRLDLLEETGCVADIASTSAIERPIAFRYDFLEVYAGASTVSSAMVQLGYVLCPPIDITFSEELNCRASHVVPWITWMIQLRQVVVGYV